MMEGFPSFEPVLTAEFTLGMPLRIGQVESGEFMTLVSFTGGRLRSVEGGILSTLIDAECINGIDTSRADPAQTFTRLNVQSVWRNKDDSNLHLSYDALIRMNEATKQIFFGHPEAKSTPFGDIFASMNFHTGNPKLKALEESLFVASGRFVVEAGQPLKVEYNIGRMVG